MKSLNHFLYSLILITALGQAIGFADDSCREPASLKKHHKTKSIAVKGRSKRENIKNWKNWNSFQINLTEVYAHNKEILGTYKLVSSKIQMSPSKKDSIVFSTGLKGQLGHMVIKRGKFYLLRPMEPHDLSDNLTQVESVDFPIRTYKKGKERFITGQLNDQNRQYFYRIKNYVPVFKQTEVMNESNQTTLALHEQYDSDVKYSCNKNQPNTYTCTATLTFTKKQSNAITYTSEEKSLTPKRIPAEKI